MVIFGFLGWKLVELMGDSQPIRDLDFDLSDAAIDNVLAVAGLICVVLLSHGLVQFLFGSIDLFARRSTEGVLVAARARRPLDWLPAPIGWAVRLLRRRHHAESGTVHDLDRRVRREIVVEADGAPRTWRVGPHRFEPSMQGQQVRISYTPMLGHVRNIQALGPASAPLASPSTPEAAPAATSAPASSAPAPPVETTSPAGTTRSELPHQGEDVLRNIPGYEHYGRSRSHFPSTDMLKMIPGMRGVIDQIPGIGDPTKTAAARPPRPEDPASPPDEAEEAPASPGSDPDDSDEPDHPG